MPTTPLLKVDSIEAGYGPINVLKGVSLTVNSGEIVTLIGANGAGKTTTLMCLAGIVPLRRGEIQLSGRGLTDVPAHALPGLGLALVPEGRKIFPRLTVLENLELGAFSRSDRELAPDFDRVFSLFPVLKERRRQAGGTLSGGEQQMLAISRALMSRPKMLLMDEPSMGVAPLLVEKIFETICELNRSGLTVLLVEQNAHLALKVANRAYVIETGSITIEDQAARLLEDPRVQEAYLGDI
ncbi:MAG: ABC transporter ATP-binding protein [Oligoflexia bacterium]|nr:ABC transporter ATP-binding protein [Oligoflexia bacterium]